jgi:aerobic-type carbon monoxide dehydrogenase small subunit (CoxS/CutS family)
LERDGHARCLPHSRPDADCRDKHCQSGMIMAAAALLAEFANPGPDVITEQITNICRCGTYSRVAAAIAQAATKS